MLEQRYEPQLAKFLCSEQETVNDQVHWHAHMNFAAQATAAEQVPQPLQTYTQPTVVLQFQSRQKNYVSTYGVLSGV